MQTGLLTVTNRLNNSVNGNPRYEVKIGEDTFVTSVDSSLGYSITNYEGKQVQADVKIYRGKPTVIRVALINQGV